MLSPEQVVRAAEHSPIMRRITMTMIERVIAQQAAWQATGTALNVSVNVSVRDLHSLDFADWVERCLRKFGVDPSHLTVELTETALINQTSAVLDCLEALGRLGVRASLDDFGTGFSSLQHLRRLPVTEIKIDRSFIQSMVAHRQEASIVQGMIDIGRQLGLRVVAEGVEDDQTRIKLLEAGCRVAQGWYYAGPMHAEEFAAWCAQGAATKS
jgi:EAL domain-containing protein (putative c-di-GMP-specific phosphodiesterase class I)